MVQRGIVQKMQVIVTKSNIIRGKQQLMTKIICLNDFFGGRGGNPDASRSRKEREGLEPLWVDQYL